jgi:HlyD family secretion protein
MPTAGTVTLKVHAGDTVTKGQVLAQIDSPDLTAKLSQEEATLAGLRIDWQRARWMPIRSCAAARRLQQAQVDQKTAQRELDRSRKAYELGAYSELQALKARMRSRRRKFAFEQAKMNYESQPEQNRFDIDSKKALLDRQQFLVADLERQVAASRALAGRRADGSGAGGRSRQRAEGCAAADGRRSVGAGSRDQGRREPWRAICAPA